MLPSTLPERPETRKIRLSPHQADAIEEPSGGSLQLARRLRLPAIFCALAVLLCALISRPYAGMGVSDDGTYILMAQHLAATGHIAYNGWATAMLGWQLYLGAAFIKLFGFGFTTVRMSTLLVAIVTAWLLQRTMVLAGVNERNATLGTLALVLSPQYLMLSVTYMSDIFGLFAVVACLYACLRALQSRIDGAAVAWLCLAVVTNALCGTARQIAWLGTLVMVPSALFLLRLRRRVLAAGLAATVAGAAFIFACMQWFQRQPYSVPEHLAVHAGREFEILSSFFHAFLTVPLLLLPIVVPFVPELRRNIRRSINAAFATSLGCILILLVLHRMHAPARPVLEPYLQDWLIPYGFGDTDLQGRVPIFLGLSTRLVLTVASLGGMLGIIESIFHPRQARLEPNLPRTLPWEHLCVLLAPFTVAYTLILIPRASSAHGIYGRYLLEPAAVALPWVVRHYQDRIRVRLPTAALFLAAIVAIYSVVIVHDRFAFYRARVVLAAEIRADGVPDTSVEYGWEYDFLTELRHASHINEPLIVTPADAYSRRAPAPSGACPKSWELDMVPHVHPLYGISFDPNACYGPAPFAPVHYSRWPYPSPGTLYVVRYVPGAERPPGMP